MLLKFSDLKKYWTYYDCAHAQTAEQCSSYFGVKQCFCTIDHFQANEV